ncbi:MAG: hypothetical protein DME71_12790 [Verrucomicrobia bacterium]|nr:MAG: hypothetical protein DME71_12790 [Verrucomicrobiota bacterium]
MHSYEGHLPVANIGDARPFYSEILGLQFAHRDLTRDAAFLWTGADRRSMLGLWGPSTTLGREFRKCHIAFNVRLAELLAAGERLNAAGIQTQNFAGEKTTEPSAGCLRPSCTSATPTVIRSSLSACWTNQPIRSLSGRSQNGNNGPTLHEIPISHGALKGYLNHACSSGK